MSARAADRLAADAARLAPTGRYRPSSVVSSSHPRHHAPVGATAAKSGTSGLELTDPGIRTVQVVL